MKECISPSTFNLTKTKMILFGNKKSNKDVKMKIYGVNIEGVNDYKFLGAHN